MSKVLIRFNKDHKSENDVWRVFVDGDQIHAAGFSIQVPTRSEYTVEKGEVKWNVACEGDVMCHLDPLGTVLLVSVRPQIGISQGFPSLEIGVSDDG